MICLAINGHHPLLFVLFFYRFSHTYAQPIGLYDMHPLSVKCRRFDTFQLLLPFNGPIKLFHSYPFDQSNATAILFFSFSLHREVLIHYYWQYVILIVYMNSIHLWLNNQRIKVIWSCFFSIGMYDVWEINTKCFSLRMLLENHIDNYYIAWRR